jgi:hypothetical protein
MEVVGGLFHALTIFLLVNTFPYPTYFQLLPLGPLPSTTDFTLKMEAMKAFKMFVSYSNTTQYHNPEELDLILHCCENLKCHSTCQETYVSFV